MRNISYSFFASSLLFSAYAPAEGFSPLTTLKDRQQPNMGLSPVHATLLHDGRVMLFGIGRPDVSPTTNYAGFEAVLTIPPNLAPLPSTLDLDLEHAPLECPTLGDCVIDDGSGNTVNEYDLLFCSQHTLLDDGTLFTLSGTRFTIDERANGQIAIEMSASTTT